MLSCTVPLSLQMLPLTDGNTRVVFAYRVTRPVPTVRGIRGHATALVVPCSKSMFSVVVPTMGHIEVDDPVFYAVSAPSRYGMLTQLVAAKINRESVLATPLFPGLFAESSSSERCQAIEQLLRRVPLSHFRVTRHTSSTLMCGRAL